MGRSYSKVLKTLFKALAFVSVIGFLLVIDHETEPITNGVISSTKTISTKPAKSVSLKRLEVTGSKYTNHVVNSDNLDHSNNYMMSQRRVPNGPDPIHNRRAGKSMQPPGRA